MKMENEFAAFVPARPGDKVLVAHTYFEEDSETLAAGVVELPVVGWAIRVDPSWLDATGAFYAHPALPRTLADNEHWALILPDGRLLVPGVATYENRTEWLKDVKQRDMERRLEREQLNRRNARESAVPGWRGREPVRDQLRRRMADRASRGVVAAEYRAPDW